MKSQKKLVEYSSSEDLKAENHVRLISDRSFATATPLGQKIEKGFAFLETYYFKFKASALHLTDALVKAHDANPRASVAATIAISVVLTMTLAYFTSSRERPRVTASAASAPVEPPAQPPIVTRQAQMESQAPNKTVVAKKKVSKKSKSGMVITGRKRK